MSAKETKDVEAKKMEQAVREVYKSFEDEGLAFLPLEALVPEHEDAEEEKEEGEQKQGEGHVENSKPTMTPEELTRETALKRDHLLLPGPLAAQACKLCAQLIAAFHASEENRIMTLWQKLLLPTADRARAHVKKEEFQLAFGELLGLLLFASQEASWVLDRQAIAEWSSFSSLFMDLSAAWGAVLAREDFELGLAPVGGREGGYRPRILGLLRAWEQETNEYLKCLDPAMEEAGSSSPQVPSWLAGLRVVRLCVVPVPLEEK